MTTPKGGGLSSINQNYKLFSILIKTNNSDKDSPEMMNCSKILYYQTMMMEGYKIDNHVGFSNEISAYDRNRINFV